MKTIKEVLFILKSAKKDIRVYFDFCRCVPTTVNSSRGYYDEPALGWGPSGHSGIPKKYPTVADLIFELEKAVKKGQIYTGWKGGKYTYTVDSPLHIDNPGDWSETEIVEIEYDGFEVIIHTRREE